MRDYCCCISPTRCNTPPPNYCYGCCSSSFYRCSTISSPCWAANIAEEHAGERADALQEQSSDCSSCPGALSSARFGSVYRRASRRQGNPPGIKVRNGFFVWFPVRHSAEMYLMRILRVGIRISAGTAISSFPHSSIPLFMRDRDQPTTSGFLRTVHHQFIPIKLPVYLR